MVNRGAASDGSYVTKPGGLMNGVWYPRYKAIPGGENMLGLSDGVYDEHAVVEQQVYDYIMTVTAAGGDDALSTFGPAFANNGAVYTALTNGAGKAIEHMSILLEGLQFYIFFCFLWFCYLGSSERAMMFTNDAPRVWVYVFMCISFLALYRSTIFRRNLLLMAPGDVVPSFMPGGEMDASLSTTFLFFLFIMFGVVGTIVANVANPRERGGPNQEDAPEGGAIAYAVFHFLIVIAVMARVFQYNALRSKSIGPTLLAFKKWWEANGGKATVQEGP